MEYRRSRRRRGHWLPVRGSDAVFPVHRIYCVGRNYAAHTIEMGGDPDREDAVLLPEEPGQPA